MRPIDADVLIDEIKRDAQKVIKQDDRVGSFWLGYIAGLVIKQPTIQPEPQEGRFERKRDGVFCSVCHYGWEFITGVPAEVEREYHYCPNCGAKMTISK